MKFKKICRLSALIAIAALAATSTLVNLATERTTALADVSTLYASPGGSGSTCSLSAPCSITGAQTLVRTLTASMTDDIKVDLRGGQYFLSTPLTFNENDSGRNGFHVIYQNYPGETPEIVGGQSVTGWTLDSGSTYKAYIGTGLSVNTLYENGTRSIKARYPNTGFLHTQDGSGGVGDTNYSQAWLQYAPGDIPSLAGIANAEVNIYGYFNWFDSVLPITSVDAANRKVYLQKPPMFGIYHPGTLPYGFTQQSDNQYFLQGYKGALDVAGEYYYDPSGGYLYYIPKSLPISSNQIIAPTMQNVIQIQGSSSSNLVTNLTFSGLKVDYSDFTHSMDNWPDSVNYPFGVSNNDARFENTEPPANRKGVFYLKNTSGVAIQNSDVTECGMNCIMLDLYNQNDVIFNNSLHGAGYNVIDITGVTDRLADPFVSKHNLIQNNNIYNAGQILTAFNGVALFDTGYNFIDHNTIHDNPGCAWTLGGSTAVTPSNSYLRNNLFSYNRVYSNVYGTSDNGNTHQFAGGSFNDYDHNISYNAQSTGTINAAFYLDNNTDRTTMTNNITYSPTNIFQNSNEPTNLVAANVASATPADWSAAGLDASQMGQLSSITTAAWPADFEGIDQSTWTASTSTGTNPQYGVDLNPATEYTTNTLQASGQWYEVDMHAENSFSSITLDSSLNDFPVGYAVYVSDNGVNWGSPIATGSGSKDAIDIGFAPQTARYILVQDKGSSTSHYWAINEFKVHGTQGPAAAAQLSRSGWVATASSSYTPLARTPDKTLDGDLGTEWHSGVLQANGQWFQLDMGAVNTINQVAMQSPANDYPRGYLVYLSNDGVNWSGTVATGTPTSEAVSVSFPPQSARYIKIIQTGSSTSQWWGIEEINVFGAATSIEPSRSLWSSTASSSYAPLTRTPDKAIDSDTGTEWHSGVFQANGQWYVANFGSPQSLDRVVLQSSSSDYPRGFNLYLSSDGASWGSPVATGSPGSDTVDVSFPLESAQYMKIVQTGSSSSHWWGINDLNTYK